MRPLVMILSTSILLWVPVAAQEPQSPFVLRVNTQLVVRTVFVKDKDGHPIEGLTAGDFVLTEDGVRQTLSVFEFQKMDDTPVASTLPCLLLSMGGQSRLGIRAGLHPDLLERFATRTGDCWLSTLTWEQRRRRSGPARSELPRSSLKRR